MEVQPFTVTSVDSVLSLVRATEYVVREKIPGDLVECGIWRGGSALAMARVLKRLEEASKQIYLYDTFEGMTSPGIHDVDCEAHIAAHEMKIPEGSP